MGTTFVTGAAIFCNRSDFQQFLSHYLDRNIANSDDASKALREICGIASRRELATCPVARRKYLDLIWEFNHACYGHRR